MSARLQNRSFGQCAIAAVAAVLSLAFLLRFFQFSYKWLAKVTEGDTNFKALAGWALVYTLVCAAIAAVAWKFPSEEVSAPAQGRGGKR